MEAFITFHRKKWWILCGWRMIAIRDYSTFGCIPNPVSVMFMQDILDFALLFITMLAGSACSSSHFPACHLTRSTSAMGRYADSPCRQLWRFVLRRVFRWSRLQSFEYYPSLPHSQRISLLRGLFLGCIHALVG